MSALSPGPLQSQPSPPWRVIASGLSDALNRSGVSFAAASSNGGVQNVWAAGTNVNGIVLRTASIQLAPSLGQIMCAIDTAAPSGVSDLSRRVLVSNFNSASSAPLVWFLPGSLLIPAGLGCWIAANTSGAGWAFTWDVL